MPTSSAGGSTSSNAAASRSPSPVAALRRCSSKPLAPPAPTRRHRTRAPCARAGVRATTSSVSSREARAKPAACIRAARRGQPRLRAARQRFLGDHQQRDGFHPPKLIRSRITKNESLSAAASSVRLCSLLPPCRRAAVNRHLNRRSVRFQPVVACVSLGCVRCRASTRPSRRPGRSARTSGAVRCAGRG